MNTQSAPPQHTPGPWITSTGRVPGLGRSLGVLKASHKPGEKGESICVVCKEDNMQPHDIANAELIAAAPSMAEEIKRLKYELACVKFQRDALLEMTWLDLPAEPDEESTKEWKRLFDEGWERRDLGQNDPAHLRAIKESP